MHSTIVIKDAEPECSLAKNCQPFMYPIDFVHIRENQVVEKIRGVGHAVQGMIIDADRKCVQVKMNLATHRIPLDASKRSMKVKTMELAETAEGRLDLTTNLEGCHREGKEVSP